MSAAHPLDTSCPFNGVVAVEGDSIIPMASLVLIGVLLSVLLICDLASRNSFLVRSRTSANSVVSPARYISEYKE